MKAPGRAFEPEAARALNEISPDDLQAVARLAERDAIIDNAAPVQTPEARIAHDAQLEDTAKALEEGRPLTATPMDKTPAVPVDEADFDPVVHVRAPQKRGSRARDPQSYSLFEFLASKGGLHPEDLVGRDVGGRPLTYAPGQNIPGGGMAGELRGIFDQINPRVPFHPNLLQKTGYSIAQAQELVEQAGYLRPGSSTSEFLELLRAELAGQKQYRENFLPAEKRDVAREKFELEAHRTGLAEDFDARMAELHISDAPQGLRRRALQIMEKEGEKDPLLAYERALMENDERLEALRRVRQTEKLEIPGWDDVTDELGAAPAAREGAAAGSAERPAGAGERAGARPGGERPGYAGSQVGDQAIAQDALRALDEVGGNAASGTPAARDFEITLIDPATGNLRKVSAREAMREAEEEAKAAAEFKNCVGPADDDIPF